MDKKLSLRARAALMYFANSDMTISAERLSEEVAEGRDAIQTALKELRDVGFLVTRKERVGNRVVTTSHVTHKGFLEAASWGLKIPLQIQYTQQNNPIEILTNSDNIIRKVTIAGRLGEEKMGYEFFEKSSSIDADERESERLKARAAQQQEYQEAKSRKHQKKVITKDDRAPEDWSVKDSILEFATQMSALWNIKPWQISGTRFFEALGINRKKYETNGLIEQEMMRIFFATVKTESQDDGERLWRLFIAKYSTLASQARTRIETPDKMATAKQQAEESWKGL
jgi:biotin operon repressor